MGPLLMDIVQALGTTGGSWDLRYEDAAMRLAGFILAFTADRDPAWVSDRWYRAANGSKEPRRGP